MQILSLLALILLSLTGYSGGAVGQARAVRDLKPRGIDLALVLVIWAGAVTSRIVWALNRWLLIVLWILVAAVIGYLAGVFRREERPLKKPRMDAGEPPSAPSERSIWERWKDFSRRMGGFQSRIILSLFYFFFVSPFALAVKTFSDPLRLKQRSIESYWLQKQEGQADIEEFRRQF
jgi:hypothetical protein